MSFGSVRKPRAADRLCYFIILLWFRSGCSAHRSSQTNNRSPPIVTETPTKHCTPLALALKLVPSGCRQSMQLHCTKGAELPVSASRTPPHCEGRGLLSASQRRWAMHCRLFHNVPSTCAFAHVPSTIRSQSRNGAPPRWQHRSPAMATAYSPLLSPARESEGGAAEMWEHGAATRHTVKVRVECSTKRQAKSTRP